MSSFFQAGGKKSSVFIFCSGSACKLEDISLDMTSFAYLNITFLKTCNTKNNSLNLSNELGEFHADIHLQCAKGILPFKAVFAK